MVAVGLVHHITQRGNARQDVFTSDSLRRTYLQLLTEHAAANNLRVVAWCLMTNHLHIAAIPERDSSMANTFRHAHSRFAQYWNTERNRIGHLWQNRFYSCPVEDAAVSRVVAYVENNPVRAGMVACAGDFEWSSARAHLGQEAFRPLLDRDWWQARWTAPAWRQELLNHGLASQEAREIREATYTGRPFFPLFPPCSPVPSPCSSGHSGLSRMCPQLGPKSR